MKGIIWICLFLIGIASATITNDWYRANDTIWVLKDEILRIHQSETVQREIECRKVYQRSYYSIFAPPMILEELLFDGDSYQPSTLEEAISIFGPPMIIEGLRYGDDSYQSPTLEEAISIFAPPMILEELRCDDDSYQPPTLEEAISILARIPNSEQLYNRKLKVQRYSEKISIEIQRIVTALWNKIELSLQKKSYFLVDSEETHNVSWEQVVEQIPE